MATANLHPLPPPPTRRLNSSFDHAVAMTGQTYLEQAQFVAAVTELLDNNVPASDADLLQAFDLADGELRVREVAGVGIH